MATRLFEPSRIILNVSGHTFVTTEDTLLKQPGTRLFQIADDHKTSQPNEEYFFDADEDVFREVLRYHRTGELHAPAHMCHRSFIRQLEFWGLGVETVTECCQPDSEEVKMEQQFQWLDRQIEPRQPGDSDSWRWQAWSFLTDPTSSYNRYTRASKLWLAFYSLVILMNIGSASLLTVPSFINRVFNETSMILVVGKLELEPCSMAERLREVLPSAAQWLIMTACILFFLVEVIVRFTVCPKKIFFVKSTALMDAIISLIEVVTLTCLFLINYSKVSSEGLCKTEVMMVMIPILATNLRAFKIAVLALRLR